MARRPPSQQLAQLAEHLDRETDVNDLTSELVRLGARKLIQELLEAEVTEVVGRERYARRDPEVHGYRNGYKRRLDTAEGWVPVDAPRSATTAEPFRSTLWPALKTRTEVLEQLAVEMYVRELSTRDIEDALADLTDGQGSLLSRSSVSRLSETLWDEYETFAQRELTGLDVVDLFANAVYESLRQQAGLNEGVLVTWAILVDGSNVLVHLGVGNKERYETWLEYFRDLVRRGLPTPLEKRRRAKVIPRFRGEKEYLKLVFGVLWRASECWQRVQFTEHERKQIERYREQRGAKREARPSSTAARGRPRFQTLWGLTHARSDALLSA